jgi:hypothetical protein
MGGSEKAGKAIIGHLQHREHIEPQKKKIHQIFVIYFFAGKMGMDQPQSFQPPPGRTNLGQRRDHNPVKCADHHIFYLAGTVDEDTYLPVQLKGELAERPGHIRTDDQIAIDSFVRKSFQDLQVVFFQATDITRYTAYSRSSG